VDPAARPDASSILTSLAKVSEEVIDEAFLITT
jgi:hypothetical protein